MLTRLVLLAALAFALVGGCPQDSQLQQQLPSDPSLTQSQAGSLSVPAGNYAGMADGWMRIEREGVVTMDEPAQQWIVLLIDQGGKVLDPETGMPADEDTVFQWTVGGVTYTYSLNSIVNAADVVRVTYDVVATMEGEADKLTGVSNEQIRVVGDGALEYSSNVLLASPMNVFPVISWRYDWFGTLERGASAPTTE